MENLDFKNINYVSLLKGLRNNFKDKSIQFNFQNNQVVSFITKDDSSPSIQIHSYIINSSLNVVYVLDIKKKSRTYGEIVHTCKSYDELINFLGKEYNEFIKNL